MEDGILNPDFVRPVSDTLCFSAKGKHVVHSCVAILLRWRCPVTIVWRVAFRVLAALNAVLWVWGFAHVRVEVLKGQPSLAHRDTLGSISSVPDMIRVATSLNHAMPSPVDWKVRESVCSHRFTSALSLMTTTTDDVTFSQISTTVNSFTSTFAVANPVRSQLGADVGKRQNGQLSKGLSRKVFDALWDSARLVVNHDIVLLKQIVVRTAKQLQLPGCSHFSTIAIGGLI